MDVQSNLQSCTGVCHCMVWEKKCRKEWWAWLERFKTTRRNQDESFSFSLPPLLHRFWSGRASEDAGGGEILAGAEAPRAARECDRVWVEPEPVLAGDTGERPLDQRCQFEHFHIITIMILVYKFPSSSSSSSSFWSQWSWYMKGVSLSKRQPAHFVSVFNKQQKEAKMLSRWLMMLMIFKEYYDDESLNCLW